MNVIDDTNAHTGLNYDYFIPTEDTIVSVCTGLTNKGAAYNFLTGQNWDGTLTTNHNCIAPRGFKITAITLTSGEIQCF